MKVKLDEGAYAPTRAHDTDGGLDIFARETQIVPAKEAAVFRTGVHVALPEFTGGVMFPKSGLNVNHDILSFGFIDEGYDGEIVAKLYNLGGKDYRVNAGDKITQLIVVPVLYVSVDVVDKIEGGERGSNGFGSTGR